MQKPINELTQKLAPLIGKKKANQILYKYNSIQDVKQKLRFEDKIRFICYKLLEPDFEEKILLSPPPASELSKENVLGTVVYNDLGYCPFGLSNKDLLMHTAILGRSGSGKTNIVFKLISELGKNNIPFLIFDWKKNYRSLTAKRKDVLVFTPGSETSPFYFNPLIPPAGVPPKIWKEFLVSAIGYAYFIGEGALTILEQGIDQAYEQFGVYEGMCKNYPCFTDVAKIILGKGQRRGREMLWMQSCTRVLYALTNSTIADSINVPQNAMPLEALLKNNVIIELDYLSPSNKVFLTQAFLLWIYFHKLAGPKSEELENLIIIEEAQNLLLKGKEEMKSGNILPKIIREFRELGLGLCFVAQEPSKMNTTAFQNTHTLIALNQRYRRDIEELGSSMSLQFKEWIYLGQIPIGSAIVNMKGSYPTSFMVKFPFVKIKDQISDQKLKEYMDETFFSKTGLKLPAPKKSSDFQLFSNQAYLYPSREKTAKDEKPYQQNNEEGLVLLLHISEHPTLSTTQHYKNLGFNYRAGNFHKKKLIDQGSIKEEIILDGPVRKKLMKVTQKGVEYLKTAGLKAHYQNEGPGHKFFKEKLRRDLEAEGYEVEEEASLEPED